MGFSIALGLEACNETPYSVAVNEPGAENGSGQTASTNSTVTGNGSISGTVVDATTQISLVSAEVDLLNAVGASLESTLTDEQGNYSFSSLPNGAYRLKFSDSGYATYQSNSQSVILPNILNQLLTVNAALSPSLASGQFRFVLTWATTAGTGVVRDMDSYLLVPGFNTNPIYYNSKSPRGEDAQLDVDATHYNGPETVTVNTLLSGTYTYYIVNYSDPCDPTAMGTSSVTVTVYSEAGMLKEYTVSPGGTGGIVYEVFTMTNGEITDVEQYQSPINQNIRGNNVSYSVNQFSEPITVNGLPFYTTSVCDQN